MSSDQAVKETQENSDCPNGVAATGQDVGEHPETAPWVEPVLLSVFCFYLLLPVSGKKYSDSPLFPIIRYH